MVDHGARLDPERAAGQPQPQREVDVLVVEEVARREAANLLPGAARDRQARARRVPAPRRRAERPRSARRAPGPDDAGEVQRVAGGVDPSSPPRRDKPLPGGPAATLNPGAADRRAAAGSRRVGVEEDERRHRRGLGADVARRSETDVAACPREPRRRRQLPPPPPSRPRGVVDDDQLVVVAELRSSAGSVRGSSTRLFQATIPS